MHVSGTALVLGARGSIGREVCLALQRHGWRVRGMVRQEGDPTLPGVEWHQGDVMEAALLMRAAQGVDLIVHAVNPPGYRDWDRLVLPMLDASIQAAEAVGARLIVPGNVYNFDPVTFPVVAEETPQRPPTRKGEIRVAMEQRLKAAAERGVRSLVLRSGDFIGPRSSSSWFSLALVKRGKPLRRLSYPGDPGVGHCWAYLPDLAETLTRLVQRESELAPFECFHFGGYWVNGYQLLEAVRQASGKAALPLATFPWWLVVAASPFVRTLREVRKMRYLWQRPLQLDDRKLVAFLGDKPYTPLDDALRVTLGDMRCL